LFREIDECIAGHTHHENIAHFKLNFFVGWGTFTPQRLPATLAGAEPLPFRRAEV